MNRLGAHGLPIGLHADWNDVLRLGNKGESIFVTFQLYLALRIYIEISEYKKDKVAMKWAQELLEKLDINIQSYAWEGDQFVRGYTEDNYIVGSKNNEEASTWLNPQSWAVISKAARPEQAKLAMEKVEKTLNTDYGAMLLYPPFKNYGMPVARMVLFNPTTKENGGIFSQPQGWLVLAETMLGNGNRAYKYYNEINPASMNESAEVRKIEPYVHGQFIEGIDSPFHGRGHVHWLTGTASTVMIALTEGILGVQPEFNGIRIDPCIPSNWNEFSMYREFRGKKLSIKVLNEKGIEKGVSKIIVNYKEIFGNFVLDEELCEVNEITVIMG